MSLKSIIEKCIALVTGKSSGDEQSGEENQEQNFEQNSQESFNVELGEPAEKECYRTKHEEESWSEQEENRGMRDSKSPVEHAADQVHNPTFFHEEDLH